MTKPVEPSAHTPAPWTVQYSRIHKGKALSVSPVMRHQGLAQMSAFGKDYSIAAANARLIAAAPNLLNELKEVLDWALVEKAPLREQEINSIRKVIAKAEGK